MRIKKVEYAGIGRGYKKKKLAQYAIFLMIGFFVVSLSLPRSLDRVIVQTQSNLAEIRIGVFNGLGAEDDCTIALESLFEWIGYTVINVDGESIRNGNLASLDVLAFPGGSPALYSVALDDSGIEQVRQFVTKGGSYFGICGGGMFASQSLGLCEGFWSTDTPGIEGAPHLDELTVNQACTGPNLSLEPTSYEVLYWGTSYFVPNDPTSIMSIMIYAQYDESAMFVAYYGHGTLFCCGPHPEFEEGSDRDGVTTFDGLNDPDSEWSLLRKVTQWLLDESSYVPQPTNPLSGVQTLFLIVITSVVITVLVLVFIQKRRANKK